VPCSKISFQFMSNKSARVEFFGIGRVAGMLSPGREDGYEPIARCFIVLGVSSSSLFVLCVWVWLCLRKIGGR
jgi:hypothetical protein